MKEKHLSQNGIIDEWIFSLQCTYHVKGNQACQDNYDNSTQHQNSSRSPSDGDHWLKCFNLVKSVKPNALTVTVGPTEAVRYNPENL